MRVPVALVVVLALASVPFSGAVRGGGGGGDGHGKPAKEAPPSEPVAPAEPLQLRVPPAPVFAIRRLSRLRVRLAAGDREALAAQSSVVNAVTAELAAFDMEVWKDARNRLALVKLVLGGGDPGLLRQLAEHAYFEPAEESLAHGALAFGEGHRRAAAELLAKVDAEQLPISLAGHVALVRAVLAVDTKPEVAVGLANRARLLSPGTLVEETAYRVMIEAAARLGDTGRFQKILSHYVWRFPRTPYFSAVLGEIATVIAEHDLTAGEKGIAWLDGVAGNIADPTRHTLLQRIAEDALRRGRTTAAAAVARIAARGADPALAAAPWIKAFEAAALALDPDPGAGSIDSVIAAAGQSATRPSDREVIEAARAIAAYISAPPVPATAESASTLVPTQADKGSDAPPASATAPAPTPGAAAGSTTIDEASEKSAQAIIAPVSARIAGIEKLLQETAQ